MSKYKGLFTFDVENHRYLPVEQADGLIAEMDYHPEQEPTEPLIKDEKIRKAVRAWAKMNMLEKVEVEPPTIDCAIITFSYGMLRIDFYLGRSDISDGKYTIAELCGEEEE